MKEFQN